MEVVVKWSGFWTGSNSGLQETVVVCADGKHSPACGRTVLHPGLVVCCCSVFSFFMPFVVMHELRCSTLPLHFSMVLLTFTTTLGSGISKLGATRGCYGGLRKLEGRWEKKIYNLDSKVSNGTWTQLWKLQLQHEIVIICVDLAVYTCYWASMYIVYFSLFKKINNYEIMNKRKKIHFKSRCFFTYFVEKMSVKKVLVQKQMLFGRSWQEKVCVRVCISKP